MAKGDESFWLYYKQWMQEGSYSPALKAKVNITRRGWDHLTSGSNSKRRNFGDKLRRLKLLKAAKFVISHTKDFKTTKRGDVLFYVLDSKFGSKKERIRVLLKKDKGGVYYFHSVMSLDQ